jgi:hypothetical protein
MTALTATLGATAYVNGNLSAYTATLGAEACYGSATPAPTTLTLGAGVIKGACPLLRPQTRCTPIVYAREDY